jgi:hypothetical protein
MQVRIFLLLLVMPTRAISGRSRLMQARFPTRTHKRRSYKEAHSLLGRRVCAWCERKPLLQNFVLSFEALFWLHLGLSWSGQGFIRCLSSERGGQSTTRWPTGARQGVGSQQWAAHARGRLASKGVHNRRLKGGPTGGHGQACRNAVSARNHVETARVQR